MTARDLYTKILEGILKGQINGDEPIKVFRPGAPTEDEAAVDIKLIAPGIKRDGSRVLLIHPEVKT